MKVCCREPRMSYATNCCIHPTTPWRRSWQNFFLNHIRKCRAEESPGRDSSSPASFCRKWTDVRNSWSPYFTSWSNALASTQVSDEGAIRNQPPLLRGAETGAAGQVSVKMTSVQLNIMQWGALQLGQDPADGKQGPPGYNIQSTDTVESSHAHQAAPTPGAHGEPTALHLLRGRSWQWADDQTMDQDEHSAMVQELSKCQKSWWTPGTASRTSAQYPCSHCENVQWRTQQDMMSTSNKLDTVLRTDDWGNCSILAQVRWNRRMECTSAITYRSQQKPSWSTSANAASLPSHAHTIMQRLEDMGYKDAGHLGNSNGQPVLGRHVHHSGLRPQDQTRMICRL